VSARSADQGLETALESPTRALWRLTLFLALTLPCMLIQFIALKTSRSFATRFPLWFHRRLIRILGIKIERRGRQSRSRPTLFVSNHSSYIDIEVLGALLPVSFVAKSEVRDWPIFGWLARLQRSVFVERRASRTANARDEMQERLNAGDNLVLFAEGTSNDGNRVLPFKSALFSVAQYRVHDEPLTVQPVSITYTQLDGMPMGRYLRPYYAWYGDMELASHAWKFLGLGRTTVVVEFHPPVSIDDFGSRKALADHCHAAVSGGVSNALAGRRGRSAPVKPQVAAADEAVKEAETSAPQGAT